MLLGCGEKRDTLVSDPSASGQQTGFCLTGDAAGSDAGDGGAADVLALRGLVAVLQQVPHLDASVLLPDEEDRRPRQRPVTHRTQHLGAGRHEDRATLK